MPAAELISTVGSADHKRPADPPEPPRHRATCLRLRGLGVNHSQTQHFFKGVEVPIAVEQRMAVYQAERRNQAVERLAYRSALPPQQTIVPRGSHGEIQAARCKYLEAFELLENSTGFRF
jgi:hypothetical protein